MEPVSFSEGAESRTVRNILVLTDGPVQGISTDSLMKLIGLREGEGLTSSAVRSAIQRLYATGLFYDVQFTVEPVMSGEVDARVILIRRFIVRAVEFRGKRRLNSEDLRPRSSVRVGEAFNPTLVNSTIEDLQAYYRRNGYYKASIQPQFEVNEKDASIKVLFTIDAGLQARVLTLGFDVEPGVDLDQIRSLIKTRPGGPYSDLQKDLDLETIEKHFRWLGYFNAQVYLKEGVGYNESDNRVTLALRIAPGPLTEVSFEGATPKREVLEQSSLYGLGGTSEVYLEETLKQLRDYYQSEGYFRVSIGLGQFPESGSPRRVTFRIEPGAQYSISRVSFEGNKALPSRLLVSLLAVRKKGGFSRGVFSDPRAEEDCTRIESLYHESGYLDAEADYSLVPISGDELGVVYRVVEGEQYHVAEARIQGNRRFTREELEKELAAIPGRPFSPLMIAHDRAAIIAIYEDLGYRDVDFSSSFSIAPGRSVVLSYSIQEGSQSLADQVLVTGNKVTRDSVMRREIKIREGDPLSLRSILETETNLYDLAVFNRVQIAEKASYQEPLRKTLIINVEEARRYTVLYGFGYSSFEGPRGTFGITDSNFRGKARPLSANVRVGSERQRGSLSWALPRFLEGRLPTVLAFTADNQKAQTTKTGLATSAISGKPFDSFRLIASSQSERRLSRRESLFFRYEFEKVQTSVPGGLEAPLEFFREESVRLSSLSLSYLNESRSDPANPEDGFLLSGDAKLSSRLFGTEAELFRLFAQGQYYQRLPRGVVWVASLRTGFVLPYGKTGSVPISERYFTGGSTTLRGLPHDLAGPLLRDKASGDVILVDENGFPDPNGRPVPLGGEALALFNTEFRFPLVRFLRGAVFYDLGNVFEKISSIPNTTMFHAVGFGLHVRTPVGPLRFDIGFNPSPPDVPGFKHWNFFFTLGNPF